jgi:long-chain fatty acid transport protein
MSRLSFSLSLAVLQLCTASTIFAGGLYLSELGTPVSLGTAGVGNVINNKSADSAFTNPAGMTGVRQDSILGGIQVLVPAVKFDSDIADSGGSDGGNAGNIAAIPSFFLVKKLPNDISVGFSLTAPLGGGVDYGSDFVGRYQAHKSILTGLGVSTSAAYKINDQWSIGAGVTAIYSSLESETAIKQTDIAGNSVADGNMKMDDIDDWAPQYYLGTTWQPNDKTIFGLLYRSEADITLEGDLNITNLSNPLASDISSRLNKVSMDLNYAQMVAIGVGYKLTDQLALLFDFDWEDWSALGEERLQIGGAPTGPIVQYADFHWKDTYHVGGALIYQLDGGQSFISTGLSYDSSPVDDKYRNFLLPMDEMIKFGLSYGKEKSADSPWAYSIGTSITWLGDGKIDQTAQGDRTTGEFETNYLVFLGGTVRYEF